MKKTNIEVNDKTYNVKIAETDEEKSNGLQNVENLSENEGMLFPFEENVSCYFHMKGTKIDLDIILINENEEVIKVYNGKANDETELECENVRYVLEVNANSNIKKGDKIEIEDYDEEEDDDETKMYVIGPNGKIQIELYGGERIMSRIHTRNLIKLAKKAKNTKEKSKYIKLGKKFLDYLDVQDNQKQEYIEIKD